MKTKKEFHYFTIFNHQKEEQYLRRQHQAGWRFVKVNGSGIYHFEECTPEDVIYQLDFPGDEVKAKGEYLKMFSDLGWTYLQDYAGYSYFCKPMAEMAGEEEIFSDDSSRIAMMERVYKKRMLPLLVIFCAVLVPQFVLGVLNGSYGLAVLYGGLLLAYIAMFAYCGVRYHQQKNG